jgi:ribosome-binding factor A
LSRRTERVNELIRAELSDLLLREVRDPRLAKGVLSITRVDVAPDLTTARVYFSLLASSVERADALKALSAAAPFFHRELKKRLDIRRVPFLSFRVDTSIEEGAAVLSRIKEAIDREEGGA